MAMYTVTRESNGATSRVRCKNMTDAALRGATKLGIRNGGMLPSKVVPYSSGSSMFNVYGWLDGCNSHTNLNQPVWVS